MSSLKQVIRFQPEAIKMMETADKPENGLSQLL